MTLFPRSLLWRTMLLLAILMVAGQFAWLQIFRTRVFGRIADERVAAALGADRSSALDQLEARIQFSLRENGNWLRFWLPSF